MKTPKSILVAFFMFWGLMTAGAATFSLLDGFDNASNNNTNVVGFGILSYDSPTALADGNYAWSSFSNLTLSFDFPSYASFSQSDLITSAAGLGVQIVGNQFYLTGPSVAVGGGSAGFVNASGNYLTTTPNSVGVYWDPPYAGGYYIRLSGTGGFQPGEYGGNYGPGVAVPEPSVYGLVILAGGCLLFFGRRREAV